MANANHQTVNDISGDGLMTVKLSLTSAQILALNSTPIELIPAPGVGFYVDLYMPIAHIIFNTLAYTTNTSFQYMYSGAGSTLFLDTRLLLSTVDRYIKPSSTTVASTSATQIFENTAIVVNVLTGNPAVGNSDIDIYASFRILPV